MTQVNPIKAFNFVIHKFRLVIIESPFHADTQAGRERNRQYLLDAMCDSIARGEAPIASHKLYTDVLDDNKPDERTIGISLGYAWWSKAAAIVFYCDLGWYLEMVDARIRAERLRLKIEERYLAKDKHCRYQHWLPKSK